jgi:hypothetical protein
MSATFQVSAFDADYLDRIRASGVDDFGNPVVVLPGRTAGQPLRCCLRDSLDGEAVAMIAHQPAAVGGAYAEVGPVFIHPQRCPGYGGSGYPDGFRHRSQLFRAYDARGWQLDNRLVEGADAEAAIEDLFSRPEVAFLHSRNAMPGCYMFAITRSEA